MEINLLVDLDTDGALGDVPDASGTAMVELVGHTLVDGAVNLDIDMVADPVGLEVGGERDVPLLPEGPREQITSPGTETVSSRHFSEGSVTLGFGVSSLRVVA